MIGRKEWMRSSFELLKGFIVGRVFEHVQDSMLLF
jgi:hypothetical protein